MDSFWGNIFRRGDEEEDTRALLRSVPIFADLDRRELDAVERIMYRRTYERGELIFRQGEPGVGMYVVQHGTVAIVYEPTEQVLSTLDDGDFFGEIALLNETPRSATARAETACTLWGLFRPELLDLVHRQPALGVKLVLPLAQIAGQRLIRADEQILALRERLHRLTDDYDDNAEPADGPTNRSMD